MKFYCVEHDECGFYAQTYNLHEYQDGICPNCYSPLLSYSDDELPLWEEESRKKTHDALTSVDAMV